MPNYAPVEDCEKYIRDELRRIENVPATKRDVSHYFRRNILYYGWLLQFENLAINWKALSTLVGASIEQISFILEDAHILFVARQTDRAFQFTDEMMGALLRVLTDPAEHYAITSQLPFFSSLLGYEFLEYMSLLRDENDIDEMGIPFVSQVINAFRDALRDKFRQVIVHTVNTELSWLRVVIHPQGLWYFVLLIAPHSPMLNAEDVRNLTGFLWSIEGELRSLNTEYPELKLKPNPDILLIAPAMSSDAEEFTGHRPEIRHMWNWSTLRFFHLFFDLTNKYKDDRDLILDLFPTFFTPQATPNVFSVRKGIQNLEDMINQKKKRSLKGSSS